MSWFPYSIRAAAVLLVVGLTGCVTAVPGYRYTVDVGGDYYYDERPAVTTSVHVLPTGAFGYSSPGGWYGSVGFGFGTYYGLGGYYGPSWGAFGPRYGYAGYWRPPYYYTPRYARPHHYYRPPYRHARPLPSRSHEQGRWNRPPPRHTPGRGHGHRPGRGMDNRLVDGTRPGGMYPSRPGRADRPSSPPHRIRTPPARSAMPGVRESPRDMAVQFGPRAPSRQVQHAIVPPSRQPLSPPPRQTLRAADAGGARRAGMNAPGPRSREAAAPQPRRSAALVAPARPMAAQPSFRRNAVTPSRPAAQPRPMPQQARPAPMPSRPAAAPMPMRSPPPASRGSSRRGGGPQHEH